MPVEQINIVVPSSKTKSPRCGQNRYSSITEMTVQRGASELEQILVPAINSSIMTARRSSANPDGNATCLPTWQQAFASLSELTNAAEITESVIRANKDMQQFGAEYILQEPTTAVLKPLKHRLKTEIGVIRASSEKEIETSKRALKLIGTIIKMKEATEATAVPSVPERPKRVRESSANSVVRQSTPIPKAPSNGVGAVAGGSVAANAPNGGLTVVLPARSPVFQAIQARTLKQLPLKPGRKVAFRVPEEGKVLASPPNTDGSGYEEAGWILATIHSEKDGKYTVQDVEGENGQEPPIYTSSLSYILPLPIASVAPNDPSHLNAYPEYRSGTFVLALYPETTSFYKAEVMASPKEMLVAGARTAPVATRAVPSYKLRFDEDEGRVRLISAEEVIDFPNY